MIERFPLPLQSTYADLLRLLQEAELGRFPLGGSFFTKVVAGKRYWYFQEKHAGVSRHRYVGPDSPALRARIEADRSALADTRQARQRRRTLVRSLLAGGYPGIEPLMGRVLEGLAAAGVFRLRGVVVGTHAFRCYAGLLACRMPVGPAVTGDLDIAQFATVSLAVDDHVEPGIDELLRKIDERFTPSPRLDPRDHPAEWHIKGEEAKVELLAPLVGPSDDKLQPLPALKGHGKPMRFLDFLIYETELAAVLHDSGVLARVPTPTRYALHKLIVSQRRVEERGADAAKAPKDLAQADALLTVLLADRRSEVEDTWSELLGRGPKWKRYARNALPGLSPDNAAALRSLG